MLHQDQTVLYKTVSVTYVAMYLSATKENVIITQCDSRCFISLLYRFTHSSSDDSAISVSIDSTDYTGNEVEQSKHAVVAQLLNTSQQQEACQLDRAKYFPYYIQSSHDF